jgi:hypothetical protein
MVIKEDLDIPRDQNLDVRNKLRMKAFLDAGVKTTEWTADEQRLQMFFDEIRSNDFHYRFTRTLRHLTKYFASDGEEYLIATEEIRGTSPIGNAKQYTWDKGITYIPKATYTSVPITSESYKQEVAEITGGDPHYEIKFTKEAVDECLKASLKYPDDPLFGVTLKIKTFQTTDSYSIPFFNVWVEKSVQELWDLCVSGKIKMYGKGDREMEEMAIKLSGLSDERIEQLLEQRKDQLQKEESAKRSKRSTT